MHGQPKKIKPPIFYGENKKVEDAESWLLGMIKCFQLYHYSPNLEVRITIYHLKGKVPMWWNELAQVKRVSETRLFESNLRST